VLGLQVALQSWMMDNKEKGKGAARAQPSWGGLYIENT
jgi:hypothetical protein